MYSQNKEEQIILEYFKDKKGAFLDLGANDGITFSNTRALAERGWRGACVEPSPTAFLRLKKNYKGNKKISCHRLAIADYDGILSFYESGELVKNGDTALVSTHFEHEKARFDRTVKYNKISVACATWETFMKMSRIKKFDFVSIDTEGMEIVILEQMDLTHVRLICVEWNGKNREKFDNYMKDFKILYVSGENLIYGR